MDIVCDIDGTLADIAHRRHYVASKPKNWGAFNRAMHLDTLHEDVAWLVRALWIYDTPRVPEWEHAPPVRFREMLVRPRVILASGRGEEQRQVTTDWLLSHKIFPEVTDPGYVYPEYPLFTYERLYMRKAGDYRSDDVVKGEILTQMRIDGYDPKMAIDDRSSVCTMWREAGLRCLQVAPGDF